jgi:hypothetical protein
MNTAARRGWSAFADHDGCVWQKRSCASLSAVPGTFLNRTTPNDEIDFH